MKFICIAAMALFFYSCNRKAVITGQQPAGSIQPNAPLLGIHTKKDLQQPPFNQWFDKNYADYPVDSFTARQLAPLLKNKKIELFMGTWCGDSKREVPRMLKILDFAGVKPSQLTMIMVDNADSAYKQSPGHEERGKDIHRVPTLLVYDNKKELNRITESPLVSLEKDLLAILQHQWYQPRYRAAAHLMALTKKTGSQQLAANSTALTDTLKAMVAGSAELNSLGYVWMATGELDKALLAFELNARIFPGLANVYDSLGEISMKLNKKDAARNYYNKVLQLQPGNANATKMLALLQ
jgi:tetratricopeptide (TPR) repeat protein